MNSQTKNYRKPAAQRKIGLSALKNYSLGAAATFLYIIFVSIPVFTEYPIYSFPNNENSKIIKALFFVFIVLLIICNSVLHEDKATDKYSKKTLKLVTYVFYVCIAYLSFYLCFGYTNDMVALCAGISILLLYLAMESKYGFIRKPRIFPNHFYLFSLPFFGVYFYYMSFDRFSVSPSLWVASICSCSLS